MPRYMVQGTFPEGLHIPATREGANLCHGVVGATLMRASPGCSHT
jgi:hypothetical protein